MVGTSIYDIYNAFAHALDEYVPLTISHAALPLRQNSDDFGLPLLFRFSCTTKRHVNLWLSPDTLNLDIAKRHPNCQPRLAPLLRVKALFMSCGSVKQSCLAWDEGEGDYQASTTP